MCQDPVFLTTRKIATKKVGINIAVIAVLMAIMAACANNEANRMIVKEIESSNGFACYQAKRQRSNRPHAAMMPE